jgi:hypothetical protein
MDRYANKRVPQQGETKIVWAMLAPIWFNSISRRQYRGVGIDPDQGPTLSNGNLNLWRGFAVEPQQGDWSLMRAHIKDVIANGNEASADYILKWIAWCLQHPGEQPEVALVIRGSKGAGKGFLMSAIRDIFGAHGRELAQEDHITGKFNSRFRHLLYVFADEAVWAGNRKGESALKKLVTDKVIEIEPKGIDSMPARNRLAVAFSANAEWVVPASKGERRWAVFDVSDRFEKGKATDTQRNTYFVPLFKEKQNGGLAAMMYDLRAWDLGDWHPRNDIPETEALASQKRESLNVYDRAVFGLLQDGVLPSQIMLPNHRDPFKGYISEAPIDALFAYLVSGEKSTTHATKDGLSKHLKKEFGCIQVTHKNVRGWKFKPLSELRASWDAAYGNVEWLGGADAQWAMKYTDDKSTDA